jgi:trans-aconitate 2-methyltransferase
MADRSSPTATELREWNAASYHRVANPHVDWGRAVLERLPLRGDETVIDAGCGTGRLTELLLGRLPEGHVIALDQSANMLDEAAAHLTPRFGDRVEFRQADLASLDLDKVADAIFSTATFHWITDHDRLFADLYRALKPGGWLVAQCGGGPNIATLNAEARRAMLDAPFAEHFGEWTGPWLFATPAETETRLRDAGFVEVDAHLVEAPVTLESEAAFREFLTTVVFGTHLGRLPDDTLRAAFVDRLIAWSAGQATRWHLDYWRLNLIGRRPEASSRRTMTC